MKKPVELEPLKKIDAIRRFSNQELSSRKNRWGYCRIDGITEYFGPIKKNSCHYVSGIVRKVYNLFINEEIGDCYFDPEQTVLP